jgi:hypothetical protein
LVLTTISTISFNNARHTKETKKQLAKIAQLEAQLEAIKIKLSTPPPIPKAPPPPPPPTKKASPPKKKKPFNPELSKNTASQLSNQNALLEALKKCQQIATDSLTVPKKKLTAKEEIDKQERHLYSKATFAVKESLQKQLSDKREKLKKNNDPDKSTIIDEIKILQEQITNPPKKLIIHELNNAKKKDALTIKLKTIRNAVTGNQKE